MDIANFILIMLFELWFFGLGIYLLVTTLFTWFRSQKSKSWITVEGTIIGTKVNEHEDKDSETGAKSIHYQPTITYSYEYSGMKYTSNRLTFEGGPIYPITDKRKAEERLSRYPFNSRVTVHCNPKKPQQSTLETGYNPKIFVYYLFWCLFLIGAATFVLLMIFK